MSWTSGVKPNLTVYDKLLCKIRVQLTTADDQLPVGGSYMGKCGVFIPFHSHQAVPIPIPIPMKLA